MVCDALAIVPEIIMLKIADFVVSATLVAVSVIVNGVGKVAGAV